MKRNWLGALSVLLCLLFVGGLFTTAAYAGGKEKGTSACSNGSDDDGDGLIDCLDPDCNGYDSCEFGTELTCDDGFDNDGDGAIDCADHPDCDSACGGGVEICNNLIDDDGDGAVDCADSDCTSEPYCEYPETTCDDGFDNDGDGAIDCADHPDCDSACGGGVEICDNCTDDDGDGLVDCFDPDCDSDPVCARLPEQNCFDGLDNDGDGATDCADSDCSGTPACGPVAEMCANGHDDDGDGDVDCADRDCDGDVACATGQHEFNILMNYELGMHCTGFEFAYCCVLPPYNSILAQVVKTDKDSAWPHLLKADPDVGLDGLGRPTVVRDQALDSNGNFRKYQLRYWHEAQPRNDGRGAPQISTLISQVESNSLLMWNTIANAATKDANGALVWGTTDGATNVMQGNGSLGDPNDNYWNAVWNHLYIYPVGGVPNLEGQGATGVEADKIRLGIDVVYPEDTGAALHPMGPGIELDLDGDGNVDTVNHLTFSGDTGTVVYTQMKVLDDLPVMLTAPRIWEALGLPLTPFEDTINFFGDPGAIDEDSIRPYVQMKAQLEEYPSGNAVLDDDGSPVIGFGDAPIDIPNCERCHSLGVGPVNSAQTNNPSVEPLVQEEIAFWNCYYNIGPGDSDWYSRLKGAAISILKIHDNQHGTSFMANWPANNDGNQATRLGHGSVICQRCHADNVIAVVKSANTGSGDLIEALTEAIHNNHKDNVASDNLGRNGGCQGCHPAHRSDGDMRLYPITETGDNAFASGDNRDAAGGCFVGRDVHSNRNKDTDGVETPSHLNAVGQWLLTNVANDTGTWKGIWCTNCHTQLGQELWRTENCPDLIHGDCITNPRGGATLADVAAAVGVSEAQAIAWLDPKNNDDTATIWNPAIADANVAIVEVTGPGGCATGYTPYLDPTFSVNVCAKVDSDGDPSYRILEGFCTTQDCVTSAQVTLDGEGHGGTAVAVPFSAADDARDHWLAPGEPHCADCHAPPYVEQSGNITAYPPFNYPRKASLFRYTRGHQDITCQGCHESIHGLYPSAKVINQDGVQVVIDTTTYAQAAYLNADGSHGPLKCPSCHASGNDGIPNWISGMTYNGQPIADFDTAVSWMHTYTNEASPLESVCHNCHDEKTDGNGYWDLISSTNKKWIQHAYRGRVSRTSMDKAELEAVGHLSGDADTNNDGIDFNSAEDENPYTTLCVQCHGDRSSNVSCSSDGWKDHLIEGRAAEKVWEWVSEDKTGSTCGW